ncbi:chymotrypsin-2-like [Trichogramma pretiosum]|uniref:chymotrypsin-2-like n=1 Tax=Trichogramma pretiosum TaxID=7493 RepID=UPI0006C9659A|nr:chymotrypsin-2-like [Trichogramma pretiosum]
MRGVIVFLSILAVAFSDEIELESRIVNGYNSRPNQRPFQVSLQNLRGSHFCGGAIVSRYWILTASHCTDGKQANQIRVVAGTINYKRPGQVRQATRIIMHERYNKRDSFRNDIALIRVSQPWAYSQSVRAVPLPVARQRTPGGANAVLSGWGKLSVNGRIPDILQVVSIKVTDQNTCARAIRATGSNVYPTNICANNPRRRQGQCNGDSGGPLTVNGVIVGVVSWSIKDPECASTRYPGLFTRVSEYMDWISPKIRT